MSEWYKPEKEDVSLSDDGTTLDVCITANDNGNIWAEIPVEYLPYNLAERAKLIGALKEAKQSFDEIPCLCNKAYADRKLIDPSCPKHNWVDHETVELINSILESVKCNRYLSK